MCNLSNCRIQSPPPVSMVLNEDMTSVSLKVAKAFVKIYITLKKHYANASHQSSLLDLATLASSMKPNILQPPVLLDKCKQTLFTTAGLAEVRSLKSVCDCQATLYTLSPTLSQSAHTACTLQEVRPLCGMKLCLWQHLANSLYFECCHCFCTTNLGNTLSLFHWHLAYADSYIPLAWMHQRYRITLSRSRKTFLCNFHCYL